MYSINTKTRLLCYVKVMVIRHVKILFSCHVSSLSELAIKEEKGKTYIATEKQHAHTKGQEHDVGIQVG